MTHVKAYILISQVDYSTLLHAQALALSCENLLQYLPMRIEVIVCDRGRKFKSHDHEHRVMATVPVSTCRQGGSDHPMPHRGNPANVVSERPKKDGA